MAQSPASLIDQLDRLGNSIELPLQRLMYGNTIHASNFLRMMLINLVALIGRCAMSFPS